MKRLSVFGFLFSLCMIILFSCQKEFSLESNLNNASFSLHDDSTKSCYPLITANGTYYNGVSANRDTNFVKIVVNVKSTGNYSISSSTSNGFSFSDSGFFSKIGFDTLTLKAKGTPILIQTTDFTLSDSLGNCSFSIDVQDSTGTGLGGVDTSGSGTSPGSYSSTYRDSVPADDGTWHFTDSTSNITYGGTITLGQLVTNTDNTSVFECQGFVTGNTNLSFTVAVTFPTSSVTTGSYQVDGITNTLFLVDISTLGYNYLADASTANEAADPSYINITDYDSTTKRIKGSFRCWAKNANGDPVLIKGSFNTVIQ
jgi:hypothetical protein